MGSIRTFGRTQPSTGPHTALISSAGETRWHHSLRLTDAARCRSRTRARHARKSAGPSSANARAAMRGAVQTRLAAVGEICALHFGGVSVKNHHKQTPMDAKHNLHG